MKGVWLCLGLVVLSLAILLACEAKDEGPTGPGTLPTDDPVVDRGGGVLLADGSDTLTVYAYVFSDWGAPLQGIAVRFTTSVGSITPSAVTDKDGRAAATLRSVYSVSDLVAQVCAAIPERADSSSLPKGKDGTSVPSQEVRDGARIMRLSTSDDEGSAVPGKIAVSEAELATASRSICLNQTIVGVTVTLAASPERIPADGVSQATLRAVLTETAHDIPVVGSLLKFSASAGSIGAEAETDAEGAAVVRLTSAPSPGTAAVKVYVGSGSAAQTDVAFAPIRMTLAADPIVLNADGESKGEIVATLLSEEMTPLRGLRVVFETDAGIVSSPETTGTDGRAVAALTSAGDAAVARVVARFAETNAESVQVSFVRTFLPAEIILSADPAEIVADGVSGSTLRAAVLDSNGVAVPNGTAIRFEVLSGGGAVNGIAATVSGAATLTLTSATRAALASVRAYAGGVADTVSVRYVPGPPARIALSADPDRLQADRVETSRITATVYDAHDNRVGAGVEVSFLATRGTIDEVAFTDSNGTTVAYYSAAFGAGDDWIVAQTSREGVVVSARILVTLLSNAPAAILLDSLAFDEVRIQGTGYPEASTMVFRVVDCYGVPIGPDRPTIVSFELVARSEHGGEYLCCLLDTTDAWGRVRTALHSGTAPGVTETIARIGSVGSDTLIESQLIPIAIHGTLPHLDHLDVDADTLNVPGNKFSDYEDPVVALVYDQFSNPVPAGTAVYFTTNYGGITGSDVTDAQGKAHAIWVSMQPYPPDGEVVIIMAQTADSLGHRITNLDSLRSSGPTAPITVSPTTFTIPNGGLQYFTYEVHDIYGKPLSHNTRIEVITTGGSLGGDTDFQMPDVISGHTHYSFFLGDAVTNESDPPGAVFVTIKVTSLNDNEYITISGTID